MANIWILLDYHVFSKEKIKYRKELCLSATAVQNVWRLASKALGDIRPDTSVATIF